MSNVDNAMTRPNRGRTVLYDWLALVCHRIARRRQREAERWYRWSDWCAARAADRGTP